MRNTFETIAIILGIIALTFFINAGLIWIVCRAFGWAFTWKLAIGVYIVEIILKSRITIKTK